MLDEVGGCIAGSTHVALFSCCKFVDVQDILQSQEYLMSFSDSGRHLAPVRIFLYGHNRKTDTYAAITVSNRISWNFHLLASFRGTPCCWLLRDGEYWEWRTFSVKFERGPVFQREVIVG